LELVGPKAGQDDELERPEVRRSEYHNEPAERLNPAAGTPAIAVWERWSVKGPSRLRLW
jgi:hypothetical protein